MEEKILIKSERYSVAKLCLILLLIGIIVSLAIFSYRVYDEATFYDYHDKQCIYAEYYDSYSYYDRDSRYFCWGCRDIASYNSKLSYVLSEDGAMFPEDVLFLYLGPIVIAVLLGAIIYLWLRSYELTVTDKRIYGKVAWGKRVDLPVDSVSATATLKFWKGISVSTASGRISFLVIKNAEEIYNVISNLLINRQQEKNIVIEKAPVTDNADQLKKYKDLLDSGVITQEEFDAKKKQLLGL